MPAIFDKVTGAAERVVVVPAAALKLIRQVDGLRPPDTGMLDPAALDVQLGKSPLDIAERFELKTHLRNCGLLPGGKPVSNVKL